MTAVEGREVLGTGLAFPFRGTHPSRRIALASGEDDVAQAIRIVLSTTPGERQMRPEFGCDLVQFVFEHLDGATLGRIERVIRRALDRWEPRIIVESVAFDAAQEGPTPQQGTTTLFITVGYLLRATMSRRNLVYPFYLVPAGAAEQ